MIGYSTILSVIKYLLTQKLVSKVYHSVEIFDHNAQRFPAYKKEDEFIYIGPDDTQHMTCYLREISGFTVDKTEDLGGGKKIYRGKIGYRAVFFNDFEKRDHSDLLTSLMAFSFYPHIQLKKLITNTEELLKEEAKVKDFTFGAQTFYKAIDFFVLLTFQANNCELNIGCESLFNPLTPENINSLP